MISYKDSSGRIIKLGRQLGRGGEGAVFACSNDPNVVAKIYTTWISDDKAEKLRWMAQQKTDKLLKISAWIIDTLHDSKTNRTVGFLMPAVSAKEIHELYSIKSRRIHFPEADWRFLINAAINLARCFYVVHANGHVIGDVNHGNFVVMSNGTIKLIDCDSYHIKVNGKTFPCEVGVSTHIPPEFQGVPLRGLDRKPKHDNFGLAVIIFQLLFLGRHPFSGNFIGTAADKTLEESIKELRFAYGSGAASRQVKQPPGTLALEAVSQTVAKLFERAFLTYDNRPTPEEWINALRELAGNLTQCGQQKSHYYLKSLPRCPWCEIESRTGAILFPVIYNAGENFDVVTLERLLQSITLPNPLPMTPPRPTSAPPASAEVQLLKRRVLKRLALVGSLEFILITGLAILVGFVGSCGGGFLFFLMAYAIVSRTDQNFKKDIQNTLQNETGNWTKMETEWKAACSSANLSNEAIKIKNKITEYKFIPELRSKKLQELEKQVYKRQLENYLDKFKIENAHIPGIGLSRVVTLESNGIETAADINRQKILSIYGFGPTYAEKLMSWRAQVERRFRFNPSIGVSDQDKQRVEYEINNLRTKLQSEIQSAVHLLKTSAKSVSERNRSLAEKASIVAQKLAQAQSNAQSASVLTPSLLILLSIWIGISLFSTGFASLNLQSTQANANTNTSQNGLIVPVPVTTNRNYAITGNANVVPSSTNKNANTSTSISDAEIALLPLYERESKATELFNDGIKFTKLGQNSSAESLYREAIRYNPGDARFHHELGYSLYRQKKFGEAAQSLKNALKLDTNNEDTQRILGLCYIEMQSWKDAKMVYIELRKSNPQSFQFQFNLGLSAARSADSFLAIDALEKAVLLKPSEPQSHYELGLQYIIAHRLNSAEQQYEVLLNIRPDLAQSLKVELDRWR